MVKVRVTHIPILDTAGTLFISAINKITWHPPPFPPLTQPEDAQGMTFCDEKNKPSSCKGGAQLCPCIHRLKVKLNSIVEFVIVDETVSIDPFNHPFHIHGYTLFVMSVGQHPEKLPMTKDKARRMIEMEEMRRSEKDKSEGKSKKDKSEGKSEKEEKSGGKSKKDKSEGKAEKEEKAELKEESKGQSASKEGGKKYVMKDTISIPSKGFTQIRFKADNPGWWLLHCHFG